MKKKQPKGTASRTHATPPRTFEQAKQLLNAIAEVYDETCAGKIEEKEAKCRGYLLQVAGGLYRNCKLENRMDKMDMQLQELEKAGKA